MAIYDKTTGKGAVCYLKKHPMKVDTSFLTVDAPGVYRKLALMSFCEQTMPAGFDEVIQTTIGFFNSTEDGWEGQAEQRSKELQSLAEPSVQP
jgi:hypothetical protein